MTRSSSGTVPIDTLLQHRAWVRSLARSMVGDPHRAADVEQEAWRLALERPPRHDRALRAWFSRVVRNAARGAGRKAATRSRIEAATPLPDAPRSPVDVLAEAELQHRLVRAVLDLDAAYRTVVLRRYFEGLTPSRIAEEDGIPLNTINTRLKRARARLRERMTGELGDDVRAWSLLAGVDLDAAAPSPVGAGKPGVGAPGSASRRVGPIATIVAAGVVTILCLWARAGAHQGPAPVAGQRPHADGVAEDETPPAAKPIPRRRPPVDDPPADPPRELPPTVERPAGSSPTSAPVPGDTEPGPAAERRFTAWVVDATGAPVEGASVTLDPAEMDDEPTSVTDERGRALFHVSGPVRRATVAVRTADGRSLRPRRPTRLVAAGADGVRFVVDRGAWIRGRVLFERGLEFPFAQVIAIAEGPDAGREVATTYADAGGAFELSVPTDGRWTVAITGFSHERFPEHDSNSARGRRRSGMSRWNSSSAEVRGVDPGSSQIVLTARRPQGVDAIRVRAERADGRPLPGVLIHAWVGLMPRVEGAPPDTLRTDSTGRCSFEGRADARTQLRVIAGPGEDRPWEADGWVTPVEVLHVRAGPKEYVLRFVAGRPIHGKIRLPTGADKSSRPDVRASVAAYDHDRRIAAGWADADGAYTLVVPTSFEGELRLVASVQGSKNRSFSGEIRIRASDDSAPTITPQAVPDRW